MPHNRMKALYPFNVYQVEKINASAERVQIDFGLVAEVRDLPWAQVVMLRFEALPGRCARCARYRTIRAAGH